MLAVPGSLRLTRAWALAGVFVLLAVSVWLRTRQLHFFYWVDEGISVGIASHPFSHIPALMRQDGSPPLYYLLLHGWMALRGQSELATHEFSLIFALLTVPAAYWLGASLFGRRTGLICTLLAAGAPYLTTYGQETRMYALVALLSLLVAGSFVHVFVLRHRRYLPLFSLSLATALYSHNWALFLGLASALAFLWCVWAQPVDRRRLWVDGAIGFGVVAVLFLPWLPTLLYQSGHTGAPWDLPPVIWSLTTAGYFLVGGRGVAMLMLLGGGAGLLSLWRLSASAGPRALAPVGILRRSSPADPGAPRFAPTRAAERAVADDPAGVGGARAGWLRLAAESLLILGVGTLLIAWLYSKHSPAWAPRYLAVVVGPLLLAFGLGLSRSGRLGMVALALTACFWVLDPVAHNLNTKSNVAAVAASVRTELGPDPLVLSTQPEQVPTLAYYLPRVRRYGTPLGPVPDPRVVDWRDALNRLRHSSVHAVLAPMIASLRPGQRVLLVVPVNFPKQPLWMKLIDRYTTRWSYFLQHDHRLRQVSSTNAKWYDAGVAVEATLYERR